MTNLNISDFEITANIPITINAAVLSELYSKDKEEFIKMFVVTAFEADGLNAAVRILNWIREGVDVNICDAYKGTMVTPEIIDSCNSIIKFIQDKTK